jgi:hypothetical protein
VRGEKTVWVLATDTRDALLRVLDGRVYSLGEARDLKDATRRANPDDARKVFPVKLVAGVPL